MHSGDLAATAFNRGHGSGARFHFIRDGKGAKVPSLYAALDPYAAVAETVFHDVPTRASRSRQLLGALTGDRGLIIEGLRGVSFGRKVRGRRLSWVRTRRDLRLIQLHDLGLKRLGLEASEITDTEASAYPRTREWAEALHRSGSHDGMVWMSRQFNSRRALTLFGDRVASSDLEELHSLRLWVPPGVALFYEIAEAAGIAVFHD